MGPRVADANVNQTACCVCRGAAVSGGVCAGMGRAPAVALAYMWWVQGLPLDPTFEELRSKRWCSPALGAIRQAAADMLYGGDPQPVTVRKKGTGNSDEVLIAGAATGPTYPLGFEHDCTCPPRSAQEEAL